MSHLPKLLLLLAILTIFLAGCTSSDQSEETIVPQKEDPIINAWVYTDDTRNTKTNYFFNKDYSFIGKEVSPVPNQELPYEVYFRGSWEKTSENHYTIIGEIIYHDFATDIYGQDKFSDKLVYDPYSNTMYFATDPSNRFVTM